MLELTVSTHPEGLVSRWLRDHARPGMLVHLEQASGEFVLPAARPERVLLISGGSGITPVMSMLRTLCDERHPDQGGEVGFLNYARSPELALYGPELEQLAARHGGVRVARGFTRDEDAGPISGRFRPEHLDAVISDHRDAAVFVCGPPALIEAVRSARADAGPCRAAGRDLRPTRLRNRRRRAAGGRHGPLREPAAARSRPARCRCSSRPRTPG